MAHLEAVRVAQDAAYAASLSDADWHQLALDPTWQELVSEQSEMVASVLAVHGHKLPFAYRGNDTATPEAAVAPAKVVGTDIARIQGLGIVTNLGQYTENMRMAGMLFMRTLRSRYPHAKIKSIDRIPERVRLLKVPEVPLPSDPLLRAAAETTGLISPLTCGLAVRYGIFVRSDYWGERRLVVHELAIRHSMSGSAGSSPFCGSIWENACRSAAPWDCFSRRRKGLSGRYVGAASKGLTLPGG